MKNILIAFTILTFSSQFLINKKVVGQEAFGQEVLSSTLYSNEIEYDDLPEPVRAVAARSEFRGMTIDKLYEVGPRKAQREDKYMIRFKNGEQYEDVYIDSEGNVVDPQQADEQSIRSEKN